MITVRQIKAARALLGWSQEELANAAGVAASTVADFEREARTPIRSTFNSMVGALVVAGIEFPAHGVLLRATPDNSPEE